MNSEDSLIVIIDRTRMISYSGGFGVSACQLELLTAEIERAVRKVVGKQSQSTRRWKDRGGNESDAHCRL